MPNIGSLTVELDLKTQQYEAGLKRSKQQIDQHATSLNALQKNAVDASRTLTSSSDAIVAAWGKSGDAAQNAIRKMEQISQKSAVSSGIREMKSATDDIVAGWGKTGEAAVEAGEKMTYSIHEANASVRTLEQLLGVHVPKALEHLITQSELIGPVLSGAFKGIALLGFIELLSRLPDLYHKLEEAVTGWNDKAKKAYEEQIALNRQLLAISQSRQDTDYNNLKRNQAENTKQIQDLQKEIDKREALVAAASNLTGIDLGPIEKLSGVFSNETLSEMKTRMEALKKVAGEYLVKVKETEAEYAKHEEANALDEAWDKLSKFQQRQVEVKNTAEAIRKIHQDTKAYFDTQLQDFRNRTLFGGDDVKEGLEKNAEKVKEIVGDQKDLKKLEQEAGDQLIKNNQYWDEQLQKIRNGTEGEKALKQELDERTKLRVKEILQVDELINKQKALSRELTSTLMRDFGSFLEHIAQDGQDFWRTFEGFGIKALDAVANYASKMGLLGQGTSGIVGALASIAPYAPIGVGAIEFGRSIGSKIGQGRNEADVFGANVLKPFQDQVGAILDLLKQSASTSTLTTEALTQAQTNFETGWQNVLDAASKTQTDVGKQAVATLTPIVSKWREAIGGFADDAMAADQATAALSAQLQALADSQKAITDQTTSLLDKILNPAGNLTAMEGALENLKGLNVDQILGAIGPDIVRIGDALTAAGRPIPPMIASLYEYANVQQRAKENTDSAAASQAAAIERAAAATQTFNDSMQGFVDRVLQPAGNIGPLTAALEQIRGVDWNQIIAFLGTDIMNVGDAMTKAGQAMPPIIQQLYDFAKASNAANDALKEQADAVKRISDINGELTGVYDDLSHALNRQLDRLDDEKASLQNQIADAQNAAARQQLEDTIANTSDLGEYYRAQARLRDFDQKAKEDQAKAQVDEIARMQDRLKEVTDIQKATNEIMQQIGVARVSENDLVDQSIAGLLERGVALEKERSALAEVTGAAEMATNTFSGLAQLLYQFNAVPSLKSYAHGTDFVPATGPYVLHKGESVIPAGGQSQGGMHFNFYGPVVGDMDAIADGVSSRVLENNRYDIQFSSKRPLTRQRGARSNRY